MLRERLLTDADRLADAVLIIPCRHGWQGHHCIRDDEGSHPGSLTPDDVCYCGEAQYLPLSDFVSAYTSEGEQE